jgi:predicted TIM-barrel fold metal-dependent hydrolase
MRRVVGACCGAAAVGRLPRAAGQSRSAAGYFDVHVHLTQSWYGPERGPLTVRDLLAWMDAHDVAQAAVLPLVSPEAFWYPVTTEYVLRETAPHRDRLAPFCAIDPRSLATHLSDPRELRDMLARYRDAGARGFGEHKPRLPIDDPLNLGLYEACVATGLPVLFHLDNEANMDRPGLPGLAGVLERFPELTMIGHGKGWWASIAGGLRQEDLHVGYPRGAVAPGGAVDALLDRFDNLYGDLSSSGAHALLRDPEFGRAFLARRADRLLFGTDYYDLAQTEFPQFDLWAALDADAATREKVAAGNARRVLGL